MKRKSILYSLFVLSIICGVIAIWFFVHPPMKPTGEQRMEDGCPICPGMGMVDGVEPDYVLPFISLSASLGLALSGAYIMRNAKNH